MPQFSTVLSPHKCNGPHGPQVNAHAPQKFLLPWNWVWYLKVLVLFHGLFCSKRGFWWVAAGSSWIQMRVVLMLKSPVSLRQKNTVNWSWLVSKGSSNVIRWSQTFALSLCDFSTLKIFNDVVSLIQTDVALPVFLKIRLTFVLKTVKCQRTDVQGCSYDH